MSVPFLTASLKPLSHGRDELARDRAAGDVVDELVGLDRVGRERLDVAARPCAYWPEPPVCFLCV